MGVLRFLALASLAACYSPDVPDCARTGECVQGVTPDAAQSPADARPDAPPDALPTVMIVVRIDGRGDVTIPSIGTCSAGNGAAECPFVVAKGKPLSLAATPKNDWEFERWEDACANTTGATCALTPFAPTTSVRARFRSDD